MFFAPLTDEDIAISWPKSALKMALGDRTDARQAVQAMLMKKKDSRRTVVDQIIVASLIAK